MKRQRGGRMGLKLLPGERDKEKDAQVEREKERRILFVRWFLRKETLRAWVGGPEVA